MAGTVKVTATIKDQFNVPIPKAVCTVVLDRTDIDEGYIAPAYTTYTADDNGQVVMDLWPNSKGVRSSVYKFTASHPTTGKRIINTTFVIPHVNSTGDPITEVDLYTVAEIEAFEGKSEFQVAFEVVQAEAAAAHTARAAAETAQLAAESAQLASETASGQSSASASAADISAIDSANSATAAAASASAAATSATNSAVSATASALSETNAAASELAAAASESNAATSAANAAASENNAAASEALAGKWAEHPVGSQVTTGKYSALHHATKALASATNAAASATSAATSATNAANSAASAGTSATNAANSATSAANSATSAATSATSASTSASTATTKATAAATSATQAATSATNAAASATSASTSATTATTAASNAGTSASQAATSATNAAKSATAAANSATASATSASQSANSATASAASATASANSASAANASEVKASQWADSDANVEVEPGKYSAKHWAMRAQTSVTGSLVYRGGFDLSGGAYPATAFTGDFYKITVAGTVSGVDYAVGDSIIFNGTDWDKIDNTEQVTSVAGKVGAVVLDKADVGLTNVDNTSDLDKPVSTAQQAALNLKLNANANAVSATKLQTARTISLTGDVTGSVSFDGSANASITAVVADDSHNHVISNVDGLQTALDSKIPATEKGAANGVATLDASGLVPSTQLPAYVDDVLEYANLAGFPATGETGKIYVALDTNKTYRWSGSAYIYITSGAVDSVNGQTGVVNITTITGNAASATKLATARTITLAGDQTGSVSFDGSTNVTLTTANVPANLLEDLKTVDGAGSGLDADLLDGRQMAEASTASTIVSRDDLGDINARLFRSEFDGANPNIGYIMTQVDTESNNYIRPSTPAQFRAAVTDGVYLPVAGNAASATKLATARTITLAGDQTGSVSFDGSTNVTLTTANVPANLLEDLKTVDGAGSGLDADLLDGRQMAVVSTASTIVSRDDLGDINARLFRSEFDTTNANIGYIMTQIDTAYNNYIRPSTPAQFRAAVTDGVYLPVTGVAAGIAALGTGGIGSYAFAYTAETIDLSPGATIAGSRLRYGNIAGTVDTDANVYIAGTYTGSAYTGIPLTGTWRLMGGGGDGTNAFCKLSLWLRIA